MARAVRRRRIAAPPSAIWAVVADPYHLPRWWPNTQRVENVSGSGEDGSWTQGETSFHTIVVWRDQATNAMETLTKGARVIVVGRPKQRSWTDQDGTEHQVTEVDAEEIGPSLRWATAKVTRTNGRKASGQ